eukprot:jgi/Galph1/1860/GphlegSOOS_G522.1
MQLSIETLEKQVEETTRVCKELENNLINFCKSEEIGIRRLKRRTDELVPQLQSLAKSSQYLESEISSAESTVEKLSTRFRKLRTKREDLLQLDKILEKLQIVDEALLFAEGLRNGQFDASKLDLDTLYNNEELLRKGLDCLEFVHSFGLSTNCLTRAQSILQKESNCIRNELIERLMGNVEWHNWGLYIREEASGIATRIAQGKCIEMATQEIVKTLNNFHIAARLQLASSVVVRGREFHIICSPLEENQVICLEWEDCTVEEMETLESSLDIANFLKRSLLLFDFVVHQTFGIDYYREVACGFFHWFQEQVCSAKSILKHLRYCMDAESFDISHFPIRLKGLSLAADHLRKALQARGMDISLASSLVPRSHEAEEDLASLCHRYVLVHARNILLSLQFSEENITETSLSSDLLETVSKKKLIDATDICPFRFPSCKVSRQSLELVGIAEKVFEDGARCLESHLCSLGSSLLSSVSEVLLLYHRIIPASCLRTLRSDLGPQAVYHNDCFLLSHCCSIFEVRKHLYLSTLEDNGLEIMRQIDFVNPSFRLQREASTFLAKSIATTKDSIYSSISKATEGGALAVCFQTFIAERIQRSLNIASFSLESLLISWKDYLPQSVSKCIAMSLLESFFHWLLQAVMALEDIPAQGCSSLSILLQKQVDEKISIVFKLLQLDDQTLSSGCSGISSIWWFSKILNSSLEEIVKLVEGGPLRRKLTRAQVEKLVTAIFEKSSYRQKCLKRIAKAYETQ